MSELRAIVQLDDATLEALAERAAAIVLAQLRDGRPERPGALAVAGAHHVVVAAHVAAVPPAAFDAFRAGQQLQWAVMPGPARLHVERARRVQQP